MTSVGRWVERRFEFDFPTELHPNLVGRLWGAPGRLEELVRGVAAEVLTTRPEPGKWSIQENAGHLFDLEETWRTRLADYLAGADELTDADVSNPKTEAARHNEQPLAGILAAFREERHGLVALLDAQPDEVFGRVAVHRRLGKPMRLVDMLLFVTEHDDHHLAVIRQLLRARTGP